MGSDHDASHQHGRRSARASDSAARRVWLGWAQPQKVSALVPEVAFLHDEAIGPETQQCHSGQILRATIGQPGLGAPGHGSLVTIDKGHAKSANRRFFLRKHTRQITRLRITERMLLPERAIGIERTDGGFVVPGPAAFAYLSPPQGRLSCIHAPTLNKSTDKQPSYRPTTTSQ